MPNSNESSLPLHRARRLLGDARGVLVLTGAGVSQPSGIPTFRGSGGLWREHRPEDLATASAFDRDPRLVWEWYAWRRTLVSECAPNAAHDALAHFAAVHPDVTLVTQNVDGLHESAAAALVPTLGLAAARRARPLALHGSLFRVRCTRCSHTDDHHAPVDATSIATLPRCPDCGALLRPGVVWFGEALPADLLTHAWRVAEAADVCLVVGTSAVVLPAASLATATQAAGGQVIEVNTHETALSTLATITLRDSAAIVVPELLAPWQVDDPRQTSAIRRRGDGGR
ncbi:MAG: SIR2 family NAD-dependent protein deacylase [Gemmatimonadaceae bacterium]